MLEGIQSGNHLLRISHPGFEDWLGDVVCDGQPRQVLADLRSPGSPGAATVAIPRPGAGKVQPMAQPIEDVTRPFVDTRDSLGVGLKRLFSSNGKPAAVVLSTSEPAPRRSFFSPLLIAVVGVIGLFALGALGIGGAYLLGFIPGTRRPAANSQITPTPTIPPGSTTKADMASIPGGTFTMGRNDGRENERPEHSVDVKPFQMDETEVTNAEYYEFVKETGVQGNSGSLGKWCTDTET